MPNGWIILDKPLGLGSTQAVGAVKRNLREAGYGKVKVGHGGTLDPLATGVLPIALGEATKLCGQMLDASKEYEFTIAFGAETDTLDLEGTVTERCDRLPTLAELSAVLPRFTGPIEQVPPAYSAIRIDGVHAYDRARAGEVVEMPKRAVTVHVLDIKVAGEGPLAEVTLRAHVSKGTYIRSLARDIARSAGTLGHVTMLRRLRAGPFDLTHAISLDNLNELGKGAQLERILLPLEAGLDDIPAIDLTPEQARAVHQGRVLTGMAFHDGLHWVRQGTHPLALVQLSGGSLTVSRGFNLPDVAE
ncbi:MAG: tRNA pseudouridine(55) synthase TruB [Novosphingobium sp.]|nr:tRNA pseudouridine(55) synthase TruB [Novosphingobium sp.]